MRLLHPIIFLHHIVCVVIPPFLLCGAFLMDPLRLRGAQQVEQEAQEEAPDS